jgi:hypothetical protein
MEEKVDDARLRPRPRQQAIEERRGFGADAGQSGGAAEQRSEDVGTHRSAV